MILASPSAVKLREYERIFTGTNQDIGYENPILNFISDTTLQTFPADKTTYFHYPITAPSGLLINADLVSNGAIAGTAPYNSDKIWKKMANYMNYSIWGNSQPVGKQTGVWLCSWLSGSQTVLSGTSGYMMAPTPIWKDRWYNPGYIDATTSMYISSAPSAVLVDIDSEMSFEGGSWYKYYHMGSINNMIIVNSLSSNNSLKLHIEDWAESTTDLSIYNTVIMDNYNSNMLTYNGVNYRDRPLDNCLALDGINQSCQVLYNSSYALTGDMTYSIWAHANDWTNIQGNHLLSKNYRGGWSLKYTNGFHTPIVTVFDRNNGNILFLNSEGEAIVQKTLPTGSKPVAAVIDDNLFTWVLDNGVYDGYKHLYKLDYNGDIRGVLNIASSETLKGLTIDNNGYNTSLTANNLLWVLGNNSHSAFDSFTLDHVVSLPYSSPISAKYCETNLDGIYTDSGLSFCFNSSGNTITAANSTIIVACDKDDYIWMLHGINEFTKYDSTMSTVILSGVVGNATELSGRCINFTNEFVNGQYKDFVWFLQEAEQNIYKYDTDGNIIKRINISKYDIHPYGIGDFTGFQKQRKFDYVRYNKIPQIQAQIFLNKTPTYGKMFTLTIPVTAISDNWHMFTFTCSPLSNTTLNFYMDSIIRDSLTISYNSSIYYEYENSLYIGANAGKNENLDTELDLRQNHFKGKLDDCRIYSCVLNSSDIRYIYLNKFNYQDLKWNIPTGNQSYLEEIERFFKFKLPGLKSQYYNIKLIGLQITDTGTREIIENVIKNTIKKITPAYAELFKIIWE